MTEDVKANVELERVSQSQLGMFIKATTQDDPLRIKKLSDLAKDISLENNVDCKVEDLEKFYNLDTPMLELDLEFELTNTEDEL